MERDHKRNKRRTINNDWDDSRLKRERNQYSWRIERNNKKNSSRKYKPKNREKRERGENKKKQDR